MRKKVFGRKFGRNTNSRKALFRGLVRSLFEHGSIVTTKAKAKAIVGEVDHIIVVAKADTVASRRQVMATLGNDTQTLQRVLDRLPSQKDRKSGFTRITALPPRMGDKAEMVKLEFVDKPVEKKVEKTEVGTKSQAKK